MNATIVERAPAGVAVHVDLSGSPPPSAIGALLTLTDPDLVLAAARSATADARWVLWHLEHLPCAEKRAAAFAVTLAHALRGELFIVLAASTRRSDRIVGHLRRAGCG